MNRLLVLLVASLLGTACVSSSTCDARTVSIGWPSFLLANGTVTSSCGAAQISAIDVFMDGNHPVGTFNCTDGGVNVTGVLNDGNHRFDVEGIDSVSGAIALRDSFTVGTSNCSDQAVNTQPSEGTVELDFSFTDVNQCTTDTSSFMWFTIQDDVSGDVITVDSSHTPTQYTCSTGHTGDLTPLPISFALASGDYTFQRMEEVTIPGNTQEAGNCSSAPFTITGATKQPVAVALAPGLSCF